MKAKVSTSPASGARMSLHVKPSPPGSSSRERSELGLAPSCVRLKKILVPVDFSEPSEKAVRYAARFAEQFGAEITLLHVFQPMVYPADFGYPATLVDNLDDAVRQQVEDRLGELASRLPHEVKRLIRVGQPYHEITTLAKELEIDLIIIATHGHTGLKHVLMGSTAERVVRFAPCPVLSVREREHDFV